MQKSIKAIKDLRWIVSIEEVSEKNFRFEAHAVYDPEYEVSGLMNNELTGLFGQQELLLINHGKHLPHRTKLLTTSLNKNPMLGEPEDIDVYVCYLLNEELLRKCPGVVGVITSTRFGHGVSVPISLNGVRYVSATKTTQTIEVAFGAGSNLSFTIVNGRLASYSGDSMSSRIFFNFLRLHNRCSTCVHLFTANLTDCKKQYIKKESKKMDKSGD
jgi:hypothetical protein